MNVRERATRLRANLRARATQLKTDLPAVFLALKHPDTPPLPKILAVIAVGYALSPIDLIPDVIPVIGLLDDIILLPALIAVIVRLIPDPVMAECRERANQAQGLKGRWYHAVPVIVVWVLLGLIIVKAVWR
ncbi:MAG: YkvA family protein [Actinomycetia bacterium]|nr:YkvA family protein [Actinomycetes bacterium]